MERPNRLPGSPAAPKDQGPKSLAPKSLAGARILVVEDEMMISMLIEEALADCDCIVVGPYDRVPAALEAARTKALDAAVLDVNLAGSKIYPVAEMLDARGIPFLLLSGYGQAAVPAERAAWQVCSKPFKAEQLIEMLEKQLAAVGAPSLQGG